MSQPSDLWENYTTPEPEESHPDLRTTLRLLLDAGLAGNLDARTEYDVLKVTSISTIPRWVMKIVNSSLNPKRAKIISPHLDDSIISLVISSILALLFHEASFEERRVQIRKSLSEFSAGMKRSALNSAIERGIHPYDTEYTRLMNQVTQFTQSLKDVVDQVEILVYKAVLIEDFLWLHPCQLTTKQKESIVREISDPWSLGDHSTLKRILVVERELEDIFLEFNATAEERSIEISRLLEASITQRTKLGVLDRFTALRTGNTNKGQSHNATPLKIVTREDYKENIRRFVRTLESLTREQQNRVLHIALRLNDENILHLDDTLTLLQNYSGTDHLDMMEKMYHNFQSIIAEVDEITPLRPMIPTKLPPTESAADIMKRLDTAKQISWGDVIKLKRALLRNEIPEDLTVACLKHIICFELSKGGHHPGKHGRPYRVELGSVVSKSLKDQHSALGQQALQELIKEGMIVSRDNGSTPRKDTESVKLSAPAMHRYRHI